MKCNNCEKKHFSKLSFILLSVAAIGFWSCKPEVTPEPVVKELSSIEITKMPEKLVYWIDQIAEFDDMEVTATYTTGEKTVVTGWTYSGFDTTTETTKQTITVSYTENEITKTTAFDISVEDVMVVGLQIAREPTKTEYYTTDTEIDLTGLKLQASYDNNSQLRVESGFTTDFAEVVKTPGRDRVVTITYMEKTATFKINVTNKYKITYTTEKGTAPAVKEGESGYGYYVVTETDLPGISADGETCTGWLYDHKKVNVGDKIAGNVTFSASWPIKITCSSARLYNYIMGSAFYDENHNYITVDSGNEYIVTLTDYEPELFFNNNTSFNNNYISLIIPEGVTEIPGSKDFSYNQNWLISVTFPHSLKTIGDKAFFRCKNLKEVIFPENLESIGTYAFAYSGIEELEVSDSVTLIGESAFSDCSKLKSIVIKADTTVLSRYSFVRCENLESVEFPSTYDNIPGEAFSLSVDKLKSFIIDVPEGTTWYKVTSTGGYNGASVLDTSEKWIEELRFNAGTNYTFRRMN